MSQTPPDAVPVEAAVKALFDGIHRGDLDAVRQLYSKDGKFYLPGGAELDPDPNRPGVNRILGSRKNCAFYPVELELLTAEEGADGLISLFDGKSFRGWVSPSGDDAPASWRIVDGALATVPRSAGVPIISLRTREEFTDFELRFEWMVHENANSGCIYRLFTSADGMEYQIALSGTLH